MKAKRQRKIIELVNKYDIETQEELAKHLEEEGFAVTQATVSRDIRELQLSKSSPNGEKNKYTTPNNKNISVNNKYVRVLSDGILAIDTAGNILVVKTVSGMAMAVGAAIDAINIKEVVGCIAGDDTIMCAVKSAKDAEIAKEYLEKYIG